LHAFAQAQRSVCGKRQQQHTPWIDAFLKKAFDTHDQCLRLAGARSCFEQIGFTTVSCRRGLLGRTATLKVKFSDFELITRNKSVALINTAGDLSSIALDLLSQPPKGDTASRNLGLGVYRSGRDQLSFALLDSA
jgi:hypothetical protein